MLHEWKEKKATDDSCPVDKRHKLHYYEDVQKEDHDDTKYAG